LQAAVSAAQSAGETACLSRLARKALDHVRKYIAEFIGTFALVLAGTGALMNPMRSLAPALVLGRLEHVRICLTACFIGATLAILSCRLLRKQECCASCEEELHAPIAAGAASIAYAPSA
jgi:hypothetical protein